MDSTKTKVVVYLILLFAAAAMVGLAIMKFGQSQQIPAETNQMTQEQRVKVLEQAVGSKSPQMQKFINNEQMREQADREADKAVSEGR